MSLNLSTNSPMFTQNYNKKAPFNLTDEQLTNHCNYLTKLLTTIK